MHIVQASVAALPIGGAQFDLVTAVETHYYWPGLVRCFGEVRRVLRPGGQFVLIAEVHGTPASGWLLRLAMAPMRASALSVEEHRKLLEEAGYEGIELTTDRRAWLCAVAETGHHRTGLLLEVTKVRSIKDWKW
ncbi:MAG TPA: methyltransferase domain-containing protein [Gemmatimonadaceae bacterium]|nr:methyltransferase domain-containing protein [Gemmatimonadaceae bacterium]